MLELFLLNDWMIKIGVVKKEGLCYINLESKCERRNINELVESLWLGENKYEVNIKITFKCDLWIR